MNKEQQRIAAAAWRACLRDPDTAYNFPNRYPDYVPDGFTTLDRRRAPRKVAYDLMRGHVGRLRMQLGKPLERSTIALSALGLEVFEEDIFSKYLGEHLIMIGDKLEDFISEGFVTFVERGQCGRTHVHALHAQGACEVGAHKVIEDDRLFDAVRYLAKHPYYTSENAFAYVAVKAERGRVGRRIFPRRIKQGEVDLEALQALTGLELSAKKVETRRELKEAA